MKRAVSFLFLCLLLSPMVANSGWVTEPLHWQISNQGGPTGATGIWVRDTLYARFNGVITSNGGALDTTSSFHCTGLGLAGKAGIAASETRSDSLIAGWIILVNDSTIASTFSTATLAIDARMGGYGLKTALSQWVEVDTVSCTGVTANDPFAVFPIRANGTFGGAHPLLSYDQLRARAVAGVGVLFSARAFWKHWVPESESQSGH